MDTLTMVKDFTKYNPTLHISTLINKMATLNNMSSFSSFMAISMLACNKAVGKTKIVKNICLAYIAVPLYALPKANGSSWSEKE